MAGDPSRGNRMAFENIGIETELVTNQLNPPFHLSQGADFIFTGMSFQMLEWEVRGFVKLPSIIQMGGYGLHFMPGGKVDRTYENITNVLDSTVTILDPKMYYEMQDSKLPFESEKLFVVPNGIPEALTNFPVMPQPNSSWLQPR